jgi:hypothetical protein
MSPVLYEMLLTYFALEQNARLKITLVDEDSPMPSDFAVSIGIEELPIPGKIPTGILWPKR